jgi:hypothetical protein
MQLNIEKHYINLFTFKNPRRLTTTISLEDAKKIPPELPTQLIPDHPIIINNQNILLYHPILLYSHIEQNFVFPDVHFNKIVSTCAGIHFDLLHT